MAIELNDGDEAPLFSSENFLWEPGRSQVATATVKNVGSLWLKYTMSFANVKLANAEGVTADITKVLDVYKIDAGTTELTEADRLGTMAELMAAGSFGAKDMLLAPSGTAGDTETITLAIKMQEEAGNEYQSAGVTFDVNILATQATVEEDGFGNPNYDANADYSNVITGTDPSIWGPDRSEPAWTYDADSGVFHLTVDESTLVTPDPVDSWWNNFRRTQGIATSANGGYLWSASAQIHITDDMLDTTAGTPYRAELWLDGYDTNNVQYNPIVGATRTMDGTVAWQY